MKFFIQNTLSVSLLASVEPLLIWGTLLNSSIYGFARNVVSNPDYIDMTMCTIMVMMMRMTLSPKGFPFMRDWWGFHLCLAVYGNSLIPNPLTSVLTTTGSIWWIISGLLPPILILRRTTINQSFRPDLYKNQYVLFSQQIKRNVWCDAVSLSGVDGVVGGPPRRFKHCAGNWGSNLML
jgi:hypothetical protein